MTPPELAYGWMCRVTEDEAHVMPLRDLRSHLPALSCWCCPTEDEDVPGAWLHHAMDQRERYESGELRLQ